MIYPPTMGEAKRKREYREQTPIVEPQNWQELGKTVLTMVIVYGTATLRAGIPMEVVEQLQANPLPEKDRQAAKDAVVIGIDQNRHLDKQTGHDLLTIALSLALTSAAGKAISRFPLAGGTMTYIITQVSSSGKAKEYNWRMMFQPGDGKPLH